MRVVVFAYHDMGIAGLEALLRAGYQVVQIFSHDDDPAENCWFGSVQEWAASRQVPVVCPEEIRGGDWVDTIAQLSPRMIFSFYYRRMIPEEILRIPPLGAYNLHGSLLPAYRGRCPVNWVLVHGEKRTGVTLHHMVKSPDAGDIVGQRAVPIAIDDTARSLYRKLCAEAGILLDQLLPLMKSGSAPRIPQDRSQASYFGGRRPEDGRIDWSWPADRVYNLIRAVTDPYPGAFGRLDDGSEMLIWWALPEQPVAGGRAGRPGSIEIDGDAVFVSTGAGRLRLVDVQIGADRMTGDGIIDYFQRKKGTLYP